MPEIHKWADIKEPFIGGALLLGNGASMAIHKEFGYASLRVAAEEHALKAAGVEEVLFFDAESPSCWIHPQEEVES